jgi:predicted transcriptional regulator
MPIPLERFKEAQAPTGDRILRLLEASPEKAFSTVEIWAAINGYDESSANMTLAFSGAAQRQRLLSETRAELVRLVENGRAQRATYQGQEYFAFGAR